MRGFSRALAGETQLVCNLSLNTEDTRDGEEAERKLSTFSAKEESEQFFFNRPPASDACLRAELFSAL